MVFYLSMAFYLSLAIYFRKYSSCFLHLVKKSATFLCRQVETDKKRQTDTNKYGKKISWKTARVEACNLH